MLPGVKSGYIRELRAQCFTIPNNLDKSVLYHHRAVSNDTQVAQTMATLWTARQGQEL